MLDQKIKVISESLARGMNRRSFVKRAGGAVVATVSTFALGPLLSNRARQVSAAPLIPAISCSPPGPYCTIDGTNLSGCHGGHCFQHLNSGTVRQCVVYYQYYSTGCWTTTSGGGYWTCCDCDCGSGVHCGCASFNAGTPPPNTPYVP